MPTPTVYWVNIQTKGFMPKGLKSGWHVVEAIEDKKGVRVRRANAPMARFRTITQFRWDAFEKFPWTPGSTPGNRKDQPHGCNILA